MEWTTMAITTLRRMAAEGKSYSDVAAVLGTTRNAIAGKAHRLGVQFTAPRGFGEMSFEQRSQMARGAWAALTPAERAARNALSASQLTNTPTHRKHAERIAGNG